MVGTNNQSQRILAGLWSWIGQVPMYMLNKTVLRLNILFTLYCGDIYAHQLNHVHVCTHVLTHV